MYLHSDLETCTRCILHKTRTHALAGEGNLNADVMLIAQAPGQCEDKANRMFVGPTGEVLHSLLLKAKIPVHELYMTNLIKCTLPKNRRPKQKEIFACSFYLNQEINTVQPAILVPLGYYATKYIFEKYDLRQFSRKGFSEVIAKISIIEDVTIFPLSHPSLLLHNEEFHESSLKNFATLRKIMESME